jgi:hypothetical protein
MEVLVMVAMVSGRLIADESEQAGVTRITSVAEMAVVAKQAEDYIRSSIKLAYDRVSPVTNLGTVVHNGCYV